MSVVARPDRATRRGAAEDRRRHLQVVEAPRSRGPRRVGIAALLLVVFAVSFASVGFHVHLATGQQRIEQLDRRAEAAQAQYERLRLEVDRLAAPSRVVERARALGMVEAREPTWLAPGSPAITEGTGDGGRDLRDYLDVKPFLRDDK